MDPLITLRRAEQVIPADNTFIIEVNCHRGKVNWCKEGRILKCG